MCMLSVVYDYHKNKKDDYWTKTNIDAFTHIAEQARIFDKATEQPNCEDPSKIELNKKINAILDKVHK